MVKKVISCVTPVIDGIFLPPFQRECCEENWTFSNKWEDFFFLQLEAATALVFSFDPPPHSTSSKVSHPDRCRRNWKIKTFDLHSLSFPKGDHVQITPAWPRLRTEVKPRRQRYRAREDHRACILSRGWSTNYVFISDECNFISRHTSYLNLNLICKTEIKI